MDVCWSNATNEDDGVDIVALARKKVKQTSLAQLMGGNYKSSSSSLSNVGKTGLKRSSSDSSDEEGLLGKPSRKRSKTFAGTDTIEESQEKGQHNRQMVP